MMNVHRLFCLLFALALGFILLPGTAARGEAVRLQVGSVQAAPGGEFEVPVMVAKPQQLGGLQFFLTYDPEAIEVTEVVVGEAAGGAMIDYQSADPGVGRVAMITNEPVALEGVLLTVYGRLSEDAVETTPLEIVDPRAWEHEQILEMLVEGGAGEVAVRPAFDWQLWLWIAAGVLLLLIVLAGASFSRRKKLAA